MTLTSDRGYASDAGKKTPARLVGEWDARMALLEEAFSEGRVGFSIRRIPWALINCIHIA